MYEVVLQNEVTLLDGTVKEILEPEQALDAVSVAGQGVLPGQVLELGVHLLVQVLPQEEGPEPNKERLD